MTGLEEAARRLAVDLEEMHDAEAIDLNRWPNAAALVDAGRRLSEPAEDPATRPAPDPTEAGPGIAQPLGPHRSPLTPAAPRGEARAAG